MDGKETAPSVEAIKEFQDILYSYPIDEEKLAKQIEDLRTICSNEEIDREYSVKRKK